MKPAFRYSTGEEPQVGDRIRIKYKKKLATVKRIEILHSLGISKWTFLHYKTDDGKYGESDITTGYCEFIRRGDNE